MKPSSPLYRAAWLLISLVLSFRVAEATPAVTLAPGVGPPTTAITVSGTGFSASAPVDIYFDVTDMCLAIATAGGTISCTFTAPKDAQPQAHYVSAVQRSPVIGAQAAFVVRT